MIKFTLFFLSLSLLIILHEFGHFITARWFKARVDKFYLFFDFLFPFSGLLKFSLFKKKIGDTEYGIGWFPFGGYVDITGMMADGEKPEAPPEPHEFRAKKPWQRLIILAGGILVNFFLAVIIYSMVAFAYGEDYLPAKNAKYGVACDSIMLNIGMRNGDKLLSIDNEPVDNLAKASASLILDEPKSIQVERNGQIINIAIPDTIEKSVLTKDKTEALFTYSFPFVADSIPADAPAKKAGMQDGDSLVSLNGDTLAGYPAFAPYLSRNKNKTVTVGFVRKGEFMTKPVQVGEDGKLGIYPVSPDTFLKFKHVDYGFFAAWGRGWQRTMESLSNYVKQFRLIFTKEGASKIGGFGTIAGVYPSEWDWEAFWTITASLSVILAFMNLLPIPVLDGGYILFVLWEMITGKKVSDKFMQRALTIGMYFVLALLIFANGNDILRAFK